MKTKKKITRDGKPKKGVTLERVVEKDSYFARRKEILSQPAFHRYQHLVPLALDYLEHLALGGNTKTWLIEHKMTWSDIDPLMRNVNDLAVDARKLGQKARLFAAEDELYRRAVEGNKRYVYCRGKRVDEYREYSDSLLQFFLRASDPDKYADRQKIEHKGVMLNLSVEGVTRER